MGGLLEGKPSQTISLEEQFDKVLPYYISIGMPTSEFWDGDVELVKAYRKAWEYKQQQWNVQAYLNGVYTYQAIVRVAPVLHAFAKRGTKPIPYLDKPLELASEAEQRARERSKALQDKIANRFEQFNKRFKKKKQEAELWQK